MGQPPIPAITSHLGAAALARSIRGAFRARRNLPYYELVKAEIVGLKVTGDP